MRVFGILIIFTTTFAYIPSTNRWRYQQQQRVLHAAADGSTDSSPSNGIIPPVPSVPSVDSVKASKGFGKAKEIVSKGESIHHIGITQELFNFRRIRMKYCSYYSPIHSSMAM